jgi:hypothetical protein
MDLDYTVNEDGAHLRTYHDPAAAIAEAEALVRADPDLLITVLVDPRTVEPGDLNAEGFYDWTGELEPAPEQDALENPR